MAPAFRNRRRGKETWIRTLEAASIPSADPLCGPGAVAAQGPPAQIVAELSPSNTRRGASRGVGGCSVVRV